MNAVDSVLYEIDRAKCRAYGAFLRAQTVIEHVAHRAVNEGVDSLQIERATLDFSIPMVNEAIESTLALSGLILSLTEEQRVSLVRAPDETYTAYLAGDVSLIDDLGLRTEAYRYIIAPSPAVTAAHESHRAHLANFSAIDG